MGRFAAIIAVFSFVFIQFVHAAVLDGGDVHAATDLHAVHGHAHSEPTDHQDSDDDDHGLGSLHQSLHENHQIVVSNGIPALVVVVLSSDYHPVELKAETGTAPLPLVPPPSL